MFITDTDSRDHTPVRDTRFIEGCTLLEDDDEEMSYFKKTGTRKSVDNLESGLYMAISLCPLCHQCLGTGGLR